ncbi:MAG: class I SAM-dependent methyltransferase [Nitrospirae bacterium]|nr:class I SAM-dependent methyltransferase [Nitrospirota bacterium]
MLAVTRCQVCDGSSRKELLVFPNDPYLRRLPTRKDHKVRYVVCTDCGFVYQPEMMDEAEMEHLYTTSYRPPQPDTSYIDRNRATAMEVYSWIIAHTGMRGHGRRVLDIGCAAGMFLRNFAQEGWKAAGLDAGSDWVEYGRREFGLDLRSEFFTGKSCPGEQFDLIIFSHVLEHVLDPAPVLAAIREKLTEDGYLFIGTPNVLAPNRKLYPGLFGGDHVRLYSPRTLAAYLRRHGFRAVTIETLNPRGLRVLAVKAKRTTKPNLRERDDWATILALYRGLFCSSDPTLLERNLAALVDHQEPVLEEVCRSLGASRKCLLLDGQEVDNVGIEVDNVGIKEADGSVRWLYGPEGSRARAQRAMRPIHDSVTTVLLVGLGLGHMAELLEARLDPQCRLHIWEADPALFMTVLQARDLTRLFHSPRVSLHVGSSVEFLRRLTVVKGFCKLGKIADPVVSSLRHHLYDEFDGLIRQMGSKPAGTADTPVSSGAASTAP